MAHYKTDSLKIGYREYWRLTRGPAVLFAWGAKLLGKQLPFPAGMPAPAGVRRMIVVGEEVPQQVRSAFTTVESQLASEGLRFLHFVTAKDSLIPSVDVFCADFSEPSGQFWVRAFWVLQGPQRKLHKQFFVAFSRLADDRLVISSNKPKEFDTPDFIIGKLVKTKSPLELARAHKRSLEAWRARPGVLTYSSQAQLESWIDDHEARSFAEGIRRGRYVEMTAQEIAAARAHKAAIDGGAALAQGSSAQDGPAQPQLPPSTTATPIVDLLNRDLAPKTSWWNGLLILVGSLIAFALIGRSRWSTATVSMLVVILFFHELGHYLAMKVFRYRNVRMFFIPLFGAAVTGHKLETAGWKKAIVALMGPAPGIFVGFVLAVFSGVLGLENIEKFALMLIVVNGFNLLPFPPLDGGWIVQGLFFSRHPIAEAIFRAIAAILLILVGFDSHAVALEILGVFVLLAIPLQYRLAKVARDVRAIPLEGPPPADSFSPALVERIAERVRPFSPNANLRTLADLTRTVYEKVIEIPPGFWATAALLVLYLGAIFGAFLGWGVVLAAREDRRNPQPTASSPPFVFKVDDVASTVTDDRREIRCLVRYPTNYAIPAFELLLTIPPPSTNFFSFSRGQLRESNRNGGAALLPELAATLGATYKPSRSKKTNVISFSTAIMGTNLTRAKGTNWVAGEFTSDQPGDWIVTKAFFGDGDLECYLSINPRDGIGIITQKDDESGPGIIKEIARLFD